MNARVRKHLKRQLAKRTPEQVAADIEYLKKITRELRKAVEKSRKINAGG
jgi:ribonuclease D